MKETDYSKDRYYAQKNANSFEANWGRELFFALSTRALRDGWLETMDPDNRRALLSHLLEAEGLPGVEDLLLMLGISEHIAGGYTLGDGNPEDECYPTIRDAIAGAIQEDNAEKNKLNFQLADMVRELEETRDLHREMCENVESLGQLVFRRSDPEKRRELLTELLEAEARERVEVRRDYDGGGLPHILRFLINGVDWCKLNRNGGISKSPRNPRDLSDVIVLATCLAAALSEKREREAQSAWELPSPNLTPDENGEICCPSCGRMVGESDWAVELADVCGACERGLT